jgi:cardiolipin synthase
LSNPQSDSDRIWTIPNFLSVGRLFLFGWFVYELFGPDDRFLAAIALTIAGLTDYLDGYVARKFNQTSEIGKFLDPMIDRMMTTGTLISFMVYGALPIWVGSVALLREVVVSLAALFVAARGVREIKVFFIGKLGTFGFMCSLPLLLFGHGPGSIEHACLIIGWIIVVPSLVLAFVSAWLYLPRIRDALEVARD